MRPELSTHVGQHATTSALFAALEPAAHPARVIHRLVTMTRERLGLEVAFVSEFGGGQRVFRFVDGDTGGFEIEVDAGDPLEETYCHHIVAGTLHGLIPDTSADPTTRDMPVTADRRLGAYVGVPVVFADGRVFGTFCAASNQPRPGLEPATSSSCGSRRPWWPDSSSATMPWASWPGAPSRSPARRCAAKGSPSSTSPSSTSVVAR